MKLPRHLGIIMDGNGRWAEERHLPRLAGHREGAKSVQVVTQAARKAGISALTLYAFSVQNWERSAEEVAGLMELLAEYLEGEEQEILTQDIRLYAELVFVETLWPDFREAALRACLEMFDQRQRRFGRVPAQGGSSSSLALRSPSLRRS